MNHRHGHTDTTSSPVVRLVCKLSFKLWSTDMGTRTWQSHLDSISCL